MFTRIKKLIALSKLSIERTTILTPDGIEPVVVLKEALGDGKAEFLGEGTTEEFTDQERADKGTKGWYDQFKRLI